MNYIVLAVGILSIVACSHATAVRQCNAEHPIPNLVERIDLEGCPKLPCRLVKDHLLNLTIKFTPEHDIKGLKNKVTAEILGAQLPFVGVDGEDACSFVYNSDGRKLNKCDLKAGQEYIFKNGFEILRVYPNIKTVVTWGLVTPDEKYVSCFKVPVRITN